MKLSSRLDLVQKICEWLKYRNPDALEYTISRNKIKIIWNEQKEAKE